MKTKTINLTDIIPDGFVIDSLNENKTAVNLKEIPKDIKERVKSVDDACYELGEDDEEVKLLRLLEPIGKQTHIYGRQEAVVIVKALNEGWVADHSDEDQYKYEMRFYFDSSAGGFVSDACDSWSARSRVGSRLCLKNPDLTRYCGNHFINVHRKYLNK